MIKALAVINLNNIIAAQFAVSVAVAVQRAWRVTKVEEP
jgi:hypothetical protein